MLKNAFVWILSGDTVPWLLDANWCYWHWESTSDCGSRSSKLFMGYFDPTNTIFDNKNKQISGWPNQCDGYNIIRREHARCTIADNTSSFVFVAYSLAITEHKTSTSCITVSENNVVACLQNRSIHTLVYSKAFSAGTRRKIGVTQKNLFVRNTCLQYHQRNTRDGM